MSDVCFIVAGMDNRIAFLERCIKCFKESRYADCDIYCYFQGGRWSEVQGREVFTEVGIDNAAHVGGLIGGVLITVLMTIILKKT